MELNLNDQNFEKEIKEAELPVLVDFFASWCPPCSMLGPILEKVAEEMKGKFILAKVNVDASPATSQKFSINSIPAVYLFKAGRPVGNFVGAMPEEAVREWLSKYL